MNERIKQLALQAGMTDDKFGMFFATDFDSHCADGVDLEKFTELLVQECFYCVEIMEKIAHASNADIPPDYDRQTYLKTLEAVTGLMKAHFGVEK